MDALFQKLDRLSSPIGTVLDKALARLAPQTTVAAASCPGNSHFCYDTCGSRCGTGHIAQYNYYYVCAYTDCSLPQDRFSHLIGCLC